MLKRLLSLTLMIVFSSILINGCSSSTPPTPQQFAVNGMWSMTMTVSESTLTEFQVGKTDTFSMVIETDGNTVVLRDSSMKFVGVRNGNSISVSYGDETLTWTISGNFSSKTLFSGTGIIRGNGKNKDKYVKSNIMMSKL